MSERSAPAAEPSPEPAAAAASETTRPVVGILGAGRAGTAFARALLRAGVAVDIASTRPPRALQHHLKIYAPGAVPVVGADIAARARDSSGIVILAVPQEELDEVDPDWVVGTVLIDATNTWQDELLPCWLQAAVDEQLPTSMALAGRFGSARVIKALNHIAHADIDDAARPAAELSQRRALAVAGDDDAARGLVMGLLDRIGFDPVSLGALAAGRIMEPDGPLFNRPLRREDILRFAR
ncbi:NAD(P)-binding domain-containing protein [Nesterenkonia sp. LB17]|uniref:NADPH-dependent F420 reductase n=1 Tax=unclassified Nesterenkonia TaxID=2629769 RepID=UPI001F4C9517|nr:MULTISPECIES: NAD(P)-binding domain-containing protein [unclassified Nesterenkonia]MCH8562664.1 NAD(P)-binding domain-containing protein [Nesterenkonia sp. YGD6]MCH8565714.1 NAD(P)-binding domain-containing protein [Nesterenkonia sp. LB17]